MKVAGIVAEYNPFHNGHLYQIDKTREHGATHIAAVMSGGFVQRGDMAIFNKWSRAKAAVLCGVDLVVELPVEYALSSANRFARAGIFLLNELRVDTLSFGSECGEIELLKKSAKLTVLAENSKEMYDNLKKGMSYPRAREEALNLLYGDEYGKIISNPNNLLGIEYIKAIDEQNLNIESFTVMREQAEHDFMHFCLDDGNIASASYLRKLITDSKFSLLKEYVPSAAFDIYSDEINNKRAPITQERIENAILYRLRMMKIDEFAALPDVNEGLENRLYSAAKNSSNLAEFFEFAKTKRYTLAKLRRIVYCALINISANDSNEFPRYINVLALNGKGMEIIANAVKTSLIPIMPKFADLYKKSPNGIDICVNASDIAALGSPVTQPPKLDFTQTVFISK